MDDVTALKKLLGSAESEERRLAAEREKVEIEYSKAKEKADLLRRLIGLSDGKASSNAMPSKPSTQAHRPAPTVESGSLEDQIEMILLAAGAPIHVSGIRQALIDAGVPLPGRGDEANVIVRLARDTERFVRTGRGTYGLTAWGMSEVRPTRKRLTSKHS